MQLRNTRWGSRGNSNNSRMQILSVSEWVLASSSQRNTDHKSANWKSARTHVLLLNKTLLSPTWSSDLLPLFTNTIILTHGHRHDNTIIYVIKHNVSKPYNTPFKYSYNSTVDLHSLLWLFFLSESSFYFELKSLIMGEIIKTVK